MPGKNRITVREFSALYPDRVTNCFSVESQIPRNKLSRYRFRGLYFRLKRMIIENCCFFFLILVEPTVLIAQLLMRKGGGLKGSYQFHRLVEIRQVLRKKHFYSAIEFGSGASTLLFQKYVDEFISIEESDSWAQNYLNSIKSLNWISRGLVQDLKSVIRVLPRLESLDASGELTCSYFLPKELAEKNFELVYIDGPTSWIQSAEFVNPIIRDKYETIANTTVLELANKPKLILIDGRRSTISYLIDKGGFENSCIELRGSYQESLAVRPYHTSIITD